MRILLWHGWLLEGSGSNVYTARVAETFRRDGHDVALVCQQARAERYRWIDATGTVDANGVSELVPNPDAEPARGRCVLLRPRIGRLLPVFVVDEYAGFDVKRFVDLTDEELGGYLDANVSALRAVARWHDSAVAIAGHAIPGSVIAKRALGPGRYVAKIHGSDLEYAIRLDGRYLALAREGLSAARAITGSGEDVLRRAVELVPGIEALVRKVSPGVDIDAFRPRPREEALLETAEALETDPETARGRPARLDEDVANALARRDAAALDALAAAYDQEVPDPDAAARLRALAHGGDGAPPIAGFFGKLIPQKGAESLLLGASASAARPRVLVVGFGTHREWLQALALALSTRDAGALEWLGERAGLDAPILGDPPSAVTFTGRLDHRYAPGVLAAMDVLVVPSILDEAFGMVAAEGAAAGAFPLVARHSGLAEIAGALESEVGRPGLFSFEPGPEAVPNLTRSLDRLLALPQAEREELRGAVARVVAREWSWRRTAERLLEAAGAA